jgi:hypothetical protein
LKERGGFNMKGLRLVLCGSEVRSCLIGGEASAVFRTDLPFVYSHRAAAHQSVKDVCTGNRMPWPEEFLRATSPPLADLVYPVIRWCAWRGFRDYI